MRLDGDALVLIINGDAKPIEKPTNPSTCRGTAPGRLSNSGNRHRRLPCEAVNLHSYDMQIGRNPPTAVPMWTGSPLSHVSPK